MALMRKTLTARLLKRRVHWNSLGNLFNNDIPKIDCDFRKNNLSILRNYRLVSQKARYSLR